MSFRGKRLLRRIRNVVLIAVGLLLLSCAVTIAEGFLRAPSLIERHLQERERLVPADLSPEQLRILLAVEDPRFYSHHGLDLTTPGAGMTTITQGLVKFLFFDSFRPGIAKIRQSLLAVGMDARIDKDQQLTLFLSSGYLGTRNGRPILGFREAAREYFGKRFEELNRDEYVSLVAMYIGPDRFSAVLQPERNRERVARIEKLLRGECRAEGWLDVYYERCR